MRKLEKVLAVLWVIICLLGLMSIGAVVYNLIVYGQYKSGNMVNYGLTFLILKGVIITVIEIIENITVFTKKNRTYRDQ